MNLILQLKMLYYRWRCRKCRKGEHDWEMMSSATIRSLRTSSLEGGPVEHCKRPSCTASR